MSGPLSGLRVVELVGLGPGPYGAMLLADLGCDVVAVDRPQAVAAIDTSKAPTSPFMRGKRGVALDLKQPGDVEALRTLMDAADVFVDPFRPGVCERLGVGPDDALARNPRLIYGRMTGWGQTGPWAHMAGHDIDYISLTGALHMIGPAGQKPAIPLNLIGDFAGGGMLLAMGVACAAFERSVSGKGQVIDAAMVDGAAMVLGPMFTAGTSPSWGPRGTNSLDGGSHFYNVYETSDGGYMAVGAIEPQFYAVLLHHLGIADDGGQWDQARWPGQTARFAEIFLTKTRAEWESVFAGTEACVAPVLAPTEVERHEHMAAREVVIRRNGVAQPNAAPRFSRSAPVVGEPVHPGTSTVAEILSSWG